MAAIMVKELEISEELDRKAMSNIIGGQPPGCCDSHACTLSGEEVSDWLVVWRLEGSCCCIATELNPNTNRLQQVWTTQTHEVGVRTITQTWHCDFCAVGCP